jgi:hypothetical protein
MLRELPKNNHKIITVTSYGEVLFDLKEVENWNLVT